MAATAIVQAGNYDLQIDTGYMVDAFILDDPVKGVLDNTTYVLDGTTQYASVITGSNNISTRRGRRQLGDAFTAGIMTFTLNDTLAGGVFNPFDTSSPFYDPTNAKAGLAPMRAVRLMRYDTGNVIKYLFTGYITNYTYTFNLGALDSVTVTCADDFYLLAQTELDEYDVPAALSGARITAVLDRPEIDYPSGSRNIADGTVNLGSGVAYTVPAGTNALQYLTQINDTAEQGRLFMSRDGVLTFTNRIGNTFTGALVTFSDDGTGTKYDGIDIRFDADEVTNRVSVATLGGDTATADDTASQATYFIQNTSISSSLLDSAADALTLATYLIVGSPEPRFSDLSTSFTLLSTAQRDAVAILDIGDTITIKKTFIAGTVPASLTQELAVEGIEHRIDVNNGHTVTIYTTPTAIVYPFILDDPTYGVLDASNAVI